jgi:hypothetical protein
MRPAGCILQHCLCTRRAQGLLRAEHRCAADRGASLLGALLGQQLLEEGGVLLHHELLLLEQRVGWATRAICRGEQSAGQHTGELVDGRDTLAGVQALCPTGPRLPWLQCLIQHAARPWRCALSHNSNSCVALGLLRTQIKHPISELLQERGLSSHLAVEGSRLAG